MTAFPRKAIAQLILNEKTSIKAPTEEKVWGLNLDQIESGTGRVLTKKLVALSELGPSTYPFSAGTVLYSKLRPYLNKVLVADDDGYATTELVPLRCNPTQVLPAYLAHYLRSPEFLSFANIVVAGAKMPRMVMSEFWRYEVPLPRLSEQLRIVAILDKADALSVKRRDAIAKLDQLLQSVFLEMFGDPVTNPMGWPMTCFGEVCKSSFRNGLSPSTDGTVPGKVLTLSAITGRHFQSQHQKDASFDRPPSDNQRVKTDTFLICRGNGNRQLVGVGVFPSHDLLDVCFPDTIIGANIAKHCSPRFIEQIWNSRWVREQIESGARTTNGTFKINQKTLERISIPIPPRELQFQFESVCTKLMALRAMMSVNAELINENIRSLQQRVFGAV